MLAVHPTAGGPAAMHPSRSLLAVALAALVALLAPAAAASAAQRYASPAGSGTTCSQAAPCSVTQAITAAARDDEVIVAPGDYPLTATLATAVPMWVHGVAGQPAPRLQFSGAGQSGLRMNEYGDRLEHVEVDDDNAVALFGWHATIDRVVVRVGASSSMGANLESTTMTNSVVVATAANARAIVTDTNGATVVSALRNVTVLSTGARAVAVEANAIGTVAQPGHATLNLVNVLAVGGSGGAALRAVTTSQGTTSATVSAVSSDFATVATVGTNASVPAVGSGTNVAAAPLFANAAAGNYHEAAASPTADAGSDDPLNGTADLDGDVRTLGAHTDIGADEWAPPLPPPPPPVGGGTGGTGGSGTGGGSTGTPTGSTPTPVAFAGVRLVSTHLASDGRRVRVALRCPAVTSGGCGGKLRLTLRVRDPRTKRIVSIVLGARAFALGSGAQRTFSVTLTRRGRALLARPRRLRARTAIAAHDAAGGAKASAWAVEIRRRSATAKGTIA